MSSTFWVSGFLSNPLFVRAEWKQLSETQETCQGLASRRRAGSALTFTQQGKSNTQKETYKFQETQGKINVNSAQEKTHQVSEEPPRVPPAACPTLRGSKMFNYSSLMCGVLSPPGFVGLAAPNYKSQKWDVLMLLGIIQLQLLPQSSSNFKSASPVDVCSSWARHFS